MPDRYIIFIERKSTIQLASVGLTQAHPNYKCEKETPSQTTLRYTYLIMKLLSLHMHSMTLQRTKALQVRHYSVTMHQFNVVVDMCYWPNLTVVMGFCKMCNGVTFNMTLPLEKWRCNFAISFGSTSATASHV